MTVWQYVHELYHYKEIARLFSETEFVYNDSLLLSRTNKFRAGADLLLCYVDGDLIPYPICKFRKYTHQQIMNDGVLVLNKHLDSYRIMLC